MPQTTSLCRTGSSTDRECLGVLVRSKASQVALSTDAELQVRDKDFMDGPWQQSNLDGGAALIIPVPPPMGGALIVGEQSIVYHNGAVLKALPMRPVGLGAMVGGRGRWCRRTVGGQSIVCHNGAVLRALPMGPCLVEAYGRVDPDGSRYLLGDHMGTLMLLALSRDKDR
ncbi:unnamed protein product [Closterium sp. NIES-53]